jgi:hypothetical protein
VWNCEPYGFGQLIGPGFEYIGEFKEGELNGHGKLKEKGKEVYDGSFKNNMKNGNGR